MIKLFRKIFTIGRVAEAPAPAPDRLEKAAPFGGSVQLRHVDAGSCNGCEIEIGSAFGPVHDAERYGARLVASPRHADAVLVTGPVTRNMAEPLRRTFEALPEPRDRGGGGRLRPQLWRVRRWARGGGAGRRRGPGRP